MSGQIFLYSSNGRTLWVPRHTPSPTETKPVCMLNFVSPMELSRSFYLFDYPVQVVESAQMAAMNPNAKTPNEVLAAVNDFRRVCAEDQSFLLQRCYNPQQQQQPKPSPQPQQQQNTYQGNYPQQMPSSSMGGGQQGYGGGGYDANKPAGGAMDNAALLAQLLQQQQQRPQQQSMQMLGGGRSGSYPDMSTANSPYSGSYGDDGSHHSGNNSNYYQGGGRGRRGGGGNMYGGYMPDMMHQQQGPMTGGVGGYGAAPYGMVDPQMMYGNQGGMGYQRGGRGGGRRDGQMYGGNYGNPMMMTPQQQQQMMMMGGGPGGRRGGMGMNGGPNAGPARMAPNARHEPEPVTIDVTIPDEIKNVYMNPSQQLVIATMPGPHMTVWLREHPIPTDTQDKKFVFGKNGVILMLKAAFDEVKASKPVELFPKQICTHFFIYGYCSRPDCFHEHHNEQQLRELIAARHVQLKAMSKTERHQLITEIEEKDKAGVIAAQAAREEREKRRAEAAAEREARRQHRQSMRGDPQYPVSSSQPSQQQSPSQSQQMQQYGSYSLPHSQANPSQDIGSDDEDEGTRSAVGAQGQSLAEMVATSASQQDPATAVKEGADAAAQAPASEALAKLGITDSDDDDGEAADEDASSASSPSQSRGSSVKAEQAEAEAESAAPEADAEADAEEDAEEEEEEAEGGETKAKKPAPKKRGRSPAPKKTAKKAKK